MDKNTTIALLKQLKELECSLEGDLSRIRLMINELILQMELEDGLTTKEKKERISQTDIEKDEHIHFLTEVKERMSTKVSKPSYETWLANLSFVSIEGNKLTFGTPNEFARDWLEGRYTQLLLSVIYQVTGKEFSLQFVVV
ncbi:DnaA N-terminal domain-containing protein [Bacillus sp. 1P06AnD]|uniref:DnaA N-terminal domain-containing protein n=1 Tax=Bacillus sp. 1P06AnD TaxID=3132208 RepID=UPI00399FB3E0